MSLTRIVGLLSAIVFIAGVLAPNHYFPWAAYYNEMPAALALVPIVIWSLYSVRGWYCFLPRHFLLLMALPLIPVLQWQSGLIRYSGDAWVASLYLSGAVLAYFCGYVLANSERCGSPRIVEFVSWLLFIGALLSAFIALRQVFALSGVLWEMEIPRGARPGANLAQPNQLSTMLLLGFLSLVYLRGTRNFGDICFVVLSLPLILGLAAVQSRSAILVELVLVVWLVFKYPRGLVERKRVVVLALSVLAFGLLLWFCWPFIYGVLQVDGDVATRSVHDAPRLLLWRQMFEAIKLVPLWGYGWGQVSFAQMAVAADYPSGFFAESAHNIFIDLLIWNGVPLGLILILAIVVWGGRRLVREQSIVSWYALALTGAVLIHGMLEFPLHYAYFLLPVALMVSVVDAHFTVKCIKLPNALIGVLAVLSFGLLMAVLIEYSSAENGFRNLRFKAMGMMGISEENVRRDADHLVVLSQMRAFLDFALVPAQEGMSLEALEEMRLVSRRYPFPPSIFRYSLALALNGDVSNAAKELVRLRNLHGEKHYLEAKEQLLSMTSRYPQIAELKFQ